MKYPEVKNIARKLRNNPTKEEKELWKYLRKRQLGGYRFLRQHPLYYDHIGNDHFIFIPDFYCPELRFIIELDGGIHQNQVERDRKRDGILEGRGFKTLRVNNKEVKDIVTLKTRILDFINDNYK